MNDLVTLLSLVKYPSITEKSISLYGNRQDAGDPFEGQQRRVKAA